MRRLLASLVATVLGVLTLLGAPPASATSPLVLVTAEFRKTSSWESGYQGTYTIKNHSRTALDSWTVEFSLPVNTTVTTHWDAQLTRDGDRYTFRSVGYNGSLAPGASTTFGWVAQGSGVPGRCVVNKGGPCEEDSDITPPTVPTGLHVTAIEDRALTLNWTASVDDRSPVVDYEIFVDGVRHSTLTGVTSHRMTGLRPNTAYMFRLLARDLAGNRSALSHAVTGATGDPSPPRTLSTAPYVDMGAWPTPSLSTLASGSGLKNFSLGAITSPTCKAMWFNHYDPRTQWAKDNIDALRAAGGEVEVTFGGAGGRELAQNCASVDALFTEYDAVVRQYGLRYAVLGELPAARTACTGNLSLCTNVPQSPYEFSRIVGTYEG